MSNIVILLIRFKLSTALNLTLPSLEVDNRQFSAFLNIKAFIACRLLSTVTGHEHEMQELRITQNDCVIWKRTFDFLEPAD